MNRVQFMLELAALLQDISVEERTEAMKYYNDYFDEAGEENEAEIIRELKESSGRPDTRTPGLNAGSPPQGRAARLDMAPAAIQAETEGVALEAVTATASPGRAGPGRSS